MYILKVKIKMLINLLNHQLSKANLSVKNLILQIKINKNNKNNKIKEFYLMIVHIHL